MAGSVLGRQLFKRFSSSICAKTSACLQKRPFNQGLLLTATRSIFMGIKAKEPKATDGKPELAAERPVEKPLLELRFVYSDFLRHADPIHYNPTKDRLERKDMMLRRIVLCVPEFYVGSILAVTVADVHAPGKTSKFVGICIHRAEHLLRHFFILRNVVDGHGIEILYDLYNPSLLTVEVLKLEKRLDPHLFYLRDALPEYSVFPFDMDAVLHPEGTPVPVNPLKVKMKNSKAWDLRWEREGLEGVEPLEPLLKEVRFRRAIEVSKPWEKYDLMKDYREHVPQEEQAEVLSELREYHKWNVNRSRQIRRRRTFVRPVKTA